MTDWHTQLELARLIDERRRKQREIYHRTSSGLLVATAISIMAIGLYLGGFFG